jgi:hypothetical protein
MTQPFPMLAAAANLKKIQYPVMSVVKVYSRECLNCWRVPRWKYR